MKVTICDKCGEIINEPWYLRHLVSLSRYVQEEQRELRLDLCPSCRASLVRWLGNYDKFDVDDIDYSIVDDLIKLESKIYDETEFEQLEG